MFQIKRTDSGEYVLLDDGSQVWETDPFETFARARSYLVGMYDEAAAETYKARQAFSEAQDREDEIRNALAMTEEQHNNA